MGKLVSAAQSMSGTLNATDWSKLWKSLLLGAAGAVVTFLLEQIPSLDFGNYTIVVVPVVTWLLNFLRKWLGGPTS